MQTVATPEIRDLARALCRGTHFHAGAALHALLMVRFSRAAGEGLWLVATSRKTVPVFSYSILALVVGTLLGGFRHAPPPDRGWSPGVGGVIVGMGVFPALVGNNPAALIVTYGCLIGLGTGFGYVAPIATLLKWFPDKRGMMVGLAVWERREPAGVCAADRGVDWEGPGAFRIHHPRDIRDHRGDLNCRPRRSGTILQGASGGLAAARMGAWARIGFHARANAALGYALQLAVPHALADLFSRRVGRVDRDRPRSAAGGNHAENGSGVVGRGKGRHRRRV